jgi:diamine N-acetyltransferase
MPTLESKNIILRVPEPSDIEVLYLWENDTKIWESGQNLNPLSKFVLNKYLETAHLDIFESKQLRLMIVLKDSPSTTIGTVDLFDFDTYNNRVGIGILIAQEEYRCKGYASEALELIIDYTFNILGLTQLYCNIAATNSASMALFSKHNFEVVGLKKKWTRRGSKFSDEYLLQLLNPQGT